MSTQIMQPGDRIYIGVVGTLRIAAKLIAAIHSEPEPSQPNGPCAPDKFQWSGKYLTIKPQQFKLLSIMCDRTKPITEGNLIDLLWGINSDKTRFDLSSPISKANAILTELNVPWSIRQKAGFVERQ